MFQKTAGEIKTRVGLIIADSDTGQVCRKINFVYICLFPAIAQWPLDVSIRTIYKRIPFERGNC